MAGKEHQQNIKALLEKISSGSYISEEEEKIAKYWLLKLDQESNTGLDEDTLDAMSGEMWANVSYRLISDKPKVRQMWPRIAAAASVFIALTLGGYFLLRAPNTPVQVVTDGEHLLPVQKGVFLALANGSKVRIDKLQKGQAENTDGTTIYRTGEAISYANEGGDASTMHTLTNQSASKFNLTLADGTETTLDVASSITYPVAFSGNERRVAITGQVYFKVKHNTAKPFFVETKNEIIEDVGTQFNVDAYADDAALRTTLVEGAVKVSTTNNPRVVKLKPGEQTILTNDKLTTAAADVEETTAWMQGKLVFNHETLESILIKVGRIYEVKFVWQQNDLRRIKMVGAVSRTRKLASVLNFFRKTGEVDFVVNGKVITVTRQKAGTVK